MNVRELIEILQTCREDDVVLNESAIAIHCSKQNAMNIDSAFQNYTFWKDLYKDIQDGKYKIETNNEIYTLVNKETGEIPVDPTGSKWENLESSRIDLMEAVAHDYTNRYKEALINYLGFRVESKDYAEYLIS